jgi:hypothetical protein
MIHSIKYNAPFDYLQENPILCVTLREYTLLLIQIEYLNLRTFCKLKKRLLPNDLDLKDNQPHVEADPYPVEVDQYEP